MKCATNDIPVIIKLLLALLGPTVDRIFVFGFGYQIFPGSVPIEMSAFFNC
jgi:hypothetical protein